MQVTSKGTERGEAHNRALLFTTVQRKEATGEVRIKNKTKKSNATGTVSPGKV